MSTATLPPPSSLMSANDFLEQHGDERGIELVRGVVRRKAMPGAKHGMICHQVSGELFVYLKTHPIGQVFINDTFVRTERSPASFRGPDIQYISYSRMPKGTVPAGVPDVAPELVIEVRSPSESWKSLSLKALEYLDANVKFVVLIDPEDESATLYRADGKPYTISRDGTLSLPELLPDFSLPVRSIFE